jgi:membrane protein implicated in regulation of membrane protease activity
VVRGGEIFNMLSYLWIGLFVLFLFVEGATMALVTIWFAGASLIALVVSLSGGPLWLQLGAFGLSSLLMLVFVFPFAKKKLKVGMARTNVDSLPGKKAVITENIEFNKFGKASINGVIWSANGEGQYSVGETVLILRIEGNKIIVVKLHDEENTEEI